MTETTTDTVDVSAPSRYSAISLLGALYIGLGLGAVLWSGKMFGVVTILPAEMFVQIPIRYQIAISGVMCLSLGGAIIAYECSNPESLSDGGES